MYWEGDVYHASHCINLKCYIFRWKDWRDKVAGELRQSVSSEELSLFLSFLFLISFSVQQFEASNVNFSQQTPGHDQTGKRKCDLI